MPAVRALEHPSTEKAARSHGHGEPGPDDTRRRCQRIARDEPRRHAANRERPRGIDLVLAAEARGFILGAALARELGVGFVPARKPGKLPHDTVSAEYILEYGVDALEMHADALADGARVLLHDDLLATGGTARALAELAEGAGARIAGCAFLVELAFLRGRAQLAEYDVHTLISYDAE